MRNQERLAELSTLNEQLGALDEAGAPLGLGVCGRELRRRLDALNAELTRRRVAGDGAESVLENLAAAMTPSYQRLVEEWLAGANLAALLESRRMQAESVDSGRKTLSYRLAYPLLVATLACVGLACTCAFTLPVVEATYDDLREPVGDGVAWLQSLRTTASIWVWGVPLLLLVGGLLVGRLRPLRLARRSRDVGAVARSRYGQLCRSAASLMEAGVAPDEAVRLAVPPNPVAASNGRPPLLAWACESTRAGLPAEKRASSADFQAIGVLYQDFAVHGIKRFTTLAPLVACVVIGGGATLVYGLALFLPVVELLWSLSS